MIEKLANLIVKDQIKIGNIDSKDAEIYIYGYILLGEIIVNMVIAFAIGYMCEKVTEIIFFFIIYIPLRSLCGGWHASSIWKCTILSNIALIALASNNNRFIQNISIELLSILFAFMVIRILHLSPMDTSQKRLKDKEYNKIKKKIYLLVLIHVFIYLVFIFFRVSEYLFIIVYAYFMQFVLLCVEKHKRYSM